MDYKLLIISNKHLLYIYQFFTNAYIKYLINCIFLH
jgi:hypothetical protein